MKKIVRLSKANMLKLLGGKNVVSASSDYCEVGCWTIDAMATARSKNGWVLVDGNVVSEATPVLKGKKKRP